MLSIHKKLWLKSALSAMVISPIVLATVISCSNTTPQKPDNGPTGEGPVGGGGSGSIDTPQLPTFLQKQLDQAQNLVINNKTWSKITNFNVERNVQTEEYVTYARRRYHETFKYPAWNWNWENPREGQNGWHDVATDWEYPHPDVNGNSQFGKPVQIRALDGAKILREERTDFDVTDKTGNVVKAKYNDSRFILNEIKNGTLKKHPAADGWFKQQISAQTKAITKQFSVPSVATGSTATGLYAAPGEVVSLKFSQKTLDQMIKQNIKNFQIVISENYWDNTDIGNPQASGSVSTRYPWVQTVFNINPEEVKANKGVFQFGSPFGGAIGVRVNRRMANPTNTIFSQSFLNFDFEISGALEMLSYIDGSTTQADWEGQIKRMKAGEISAPAMSIDLPLLALNIPSTDLNQFAGVNYDQIVFPEAIAKKWNSFMFLTEFMASRDKDYQLDKTGNFTKLFLRFCDDIWINGAGAIAGNNSFAAPISWSANSFLRGLDGWNLFGNNWGVFHEVNHNFEQNGALFSQQSHGTTNQSTMYIMTMLSDNGRFRNLYNPLGQLGGDPNNGWNVRMSSAFNTLSYVNKQVQAGKTASGEYELPTILAFQLGSFNMMQYIRNDAYNGAKSSGMREVIQLSNAFKTNFWPAIKAFSKFWNWSDWTNGPNPAEQKELDEIANKFPAVNFVANMFATGSYIYSKEKDQFLYTNDTSAPLIAATNAPYVLDFEKGITSFDNQVQWEQLNFSQTTKLGGKLVQDPNNAKRLIYVPPKDVYNQIDEFDVGILPTNRDANFVSEYRWKIKMNLVSNLPVVTMYNDPSTQYINGKGKDFYQEQDYMDQVKNYAFQAPIDVRKGIYSDHYKVAANAWQKAKVSFKFVAPESGEYSFKIKGDSWFFIDVDDEHKQDPKQLWWKANSVPSQDFINTSRLNLKKGESVKFDVYLTQKRGANRLNMQAVVNETTYDIFDHITSPFADASEALLGFDYQPRQADQNLINHNLTKPISNGLINLIATDQYRFELVGDNRPAEITQWLKEDDSQKWEVWGQKNQPITKELIVKFNQPQTIGTIGFTQGNPNWLAAKPTAIIIKDQDGKEVYNDRFGKDFNDRNHRTSVVNFAKPLTNVTQLSITLTNTRGVSDGKSAISLDTIQFSSDSYHYLNRIIDVQNPAIKYFGDNWNLVANDVATNVSQIGSYYATNNAKYQYLEFETSATGFDIVGQKGANLSTFDLYVNDKFIGAFDPKNNEQLNSQILASYRSDDWATSQRLKIKVVNRDDKPLNLDGFQLYGRQVEV